MSNTDPIRLTRVEPQVDYRLRLEYSDGASGVVDLSHLVGKGVFRLWEDPATFQCATIGAGGEVRWTDDVDLCADSLYLDLTGKSAEAIFPALGPAQTHA